MIDPAKMGTARSGCFAINKSLGSTGLEFCPESNFLTSWIYSYTHK